LFGFALIEAVAIAAHLKNVDVIGTPEADIAAVGHMSFHLVQLV